MRKIYLAPLVITCLLSACGGGSSPQSVQPMPKPRFGSQISFGDSLSDAGTYAVGKVKELGGGKFTINGDNTTLNPELTGKNWTELMAASFGLPAPCAAQTGLDGDPSQGFSVPVQNHAGCFGYAQGGARVTEPEGPGHKATGSDLGALTVPVKEQIARHLALSGGKFKPDDIVLVMAGGNDLLSQLHKIKVQARSTAEKEYFNLLAKALAFNAHDQPAAQQAIKQTIVEQLAKPKSTQRSVTKAAIATAAIQAGNEVLVKEDGFSQLVQQAGEGAAAAGDEAAVKYVQEHSAQFVAAMSTAGAELAGLVTDQIVANGAQYVVVNNLPDVALTPAGIKMGEQFQPLITAMVKAFNAELSSAFSARERVALVDAYTLSQHAAAHPGAYGLSNVREMACDMSRDKNSLGNALICNAANLQAGDISRYAYADEVHPTPYFSSLLMKKVLEKMQLLSWL